MAENFVYTAAFLLLLGSGLWGLYAHGLIAVQAKRAMLFMGSLRGETARFSSCTGYVMRRFPVKESRIYRLDLDLQVHSGEVWAELQDRNKKPLLRLDGRNRSRQISLERGERYRLVIRYKSASGEHRLTWQ